MEQYEDNNISKILNVINYTKNKEAIYTGKDFESAYHSIQLKDKYFRGQRENSIRFKNLKYNFSDKTVMDLGCNIGGALHIIAKTIKFGIGIDYDYKCINAANLIKDFNKDYNLAFYVFDLDKEDLNQINNFILETKIDICFLLSVCMWLKKWKDVISFCNNISNDLLFETNGNKTQQEEQIRFLQEIYPNITLVTPISIDDPTQINRKLLLCRKH